MSDQTELEYEGSPGRDIQRVAGSRTGMVSTQHWAATQAGVRMFEKGGNAFDAAVAAAFALGVCEPAASGLGGQTAVLLRLGEARRTLALDGSSHAPHRAVPGTLTQEDIRRGHRSTTVPSTPAVLDYLRDRYGRLSLGDVLEPAIGLAEEGFPVSELHHRLTAREAKRLRAHGAAALFLKDGKRPHPVGAVFRQPVLARTLKRLAREGVTDFYTGRIARSIHRDMERHGGLIRRDDLAQIPIPVERRPLRGSFGRYRVITFPPPGAGRILVSMLSILQELQAFPDLDSPSGALLLAEIIRTANQDRRDQPLDPSLYTQLGEGMLDPKHLGKTARAIRRRIRRPTARRGETTHLSVMDAEGNAVALTQSIERVYGSCAASPELGFLYNNYMTAFELEDPGHPYSLRPNAVPWASVAPTIVMRNRAPWLAIGSPGSERIASSVLQVLLRVRQQSLAEAVAAPRLHCSVKGTVSLEAGRMRDDIPRRLRQHGFEIDHRDPYSFYLGCVQAVMKQGRDLVGVADLRRDGAAGGPAE